MGISRSTLPNFIRILFNELFENRFVMEVMLSDFSRTIDFSTNDSKRVRIFKRYWTAQLNNDSDDQTKNINSIVEEFDLYLMLSYKIQKDKNILFPTPNSEQSFILFHNAEIHVTNFLNELNGTNIYHNI